MVSSLIVVYQEGVPVSSPGSNVDGLILNKTITLTNYDNTGITSWNWNLLKIPSDSRAGLNELSAPSASFTPDSLGKYIVQLKVNNLASSIVFLNVQLLKSSVKTDSISSWTQLNKIAAEIIITQNDISGKAGESRNDLELDKKITLNNKYTKGIKSFDWSFISKPTNSSSFLDGPSSIDGYDGYFTPDVTGSYLIQLTINNNLIDRVIACVKTEKLGLILPATSENGEFEGGWGQSLNYNTKTIERHGIHDNVANEIALIRSKLFPTINDYLLIEDSDDGYSKKSIQIGDLPNIYGQYIEIQYTATDSGEKNYILYYIPTSSISSYSGKTI